MKTQKGITLVALVITIIVLVILATITIVEINGDNGLLKRSESASKAAEMATIEEQITITQHESLVKKYYNQTTSSVNLEETKIATTQTVNLKVAAEVEPLLNIDGTPGGTVLSDIAYSLKNNETLIKIANKTSALNVKLNDTDITLTVGDNYKYGVTEDSYTFLGTKEQANGGGAGSGKTQGPTVVGIADVKTTEGQAVQALSTTEIIMVRDQSETPVEIPVPAGYGIAYDSATTVDFGIVIEDTTGTASTRGNQFVWVPSDSPSDRYETIESTELGGEGITGIKTTLQTKESTAMSGYAATKRGVIGTKSGYREPDIINDASSDKNIANLEKAGFTGENSISDFAKDLVDTYKQSINSVEYYKGFWIGRYELSGNRENPKVIVDFPICSLTKTDNNELAKINWYDFYKMCKNFGTVTNGTASSEMPWGYQWDEVCNFICKRGNKKDPHAPAMYGNFKDGKVLDNDGNILVSTKEAKVIQSGITNYTKTNNIFDLSGNVYEFTKEASAGQRVVRGGAYDAKWSNQNYIQNRKAFNPTLAFGCRPVMYVNVPE